MIDDKFILDTLAATKLSDDNVYIITDDMEGYCFLYRGNPAEFGAWMRRTLEHIFGDVEIQRAFVENDIVFDDARMSINRVYKARLRRCDIKTFLSVVEPCARVR